MRAFGWCLIVALVLGPALLQGCAEVDGEPDEAFGIGEHVLGKGHYNPNRVLRCGPDGCEPDGTLSATAAINDPGNAWTTILLDEGVYSIDERWVLQPGMQVIGAGRDETIIDGTNVLWSGFDDDYSALIGMGEANLVQGLTVVNSRLWATIGSEPGDVGDPPFSATIREVSVLGPTPSDFADDPAKRVNSSPIGIFFNGGDRPGETSRVVIDDTIVDGILGHTLCDPKWGCVVADPENPISSTRGFGIFIATGLADGTVRANIRDSQSTGSTIPLVMEVFRTEGGRVELDSSNSAFISSGNFGALILAGGDSGTGGYPDPRANDPMEGAFNGRIEWTSRHDRFFGWTASVFLWGSRDHFPSEERITCLYDFEVVEDGTTSVERGQHDPPCVDDPSHAPHDPGEGVLLGEVEHVIPGSGPASGNELDATLIRPVFQQGAPFDLWVDYGAPAGFDRGSENSVEATVISPRRDSGARPFDLTCFNPFAGTCNGVDDFGNEITTTIIPRGRP